VRYPIFLILGALVSGCASNLPSPWVVLDTDTSPATTSLDCGSFPFPDSATDESITYSKAGTNDLEAYRECSDANKAIVDQNAAQIDQLKLARKGLVEAGQAQRQIADMRETMLNDERRSNAFMSAGYWVVILAMGLAL